MWLAVGLLGNITIEIFQGLLLKVEALFCYKLRLAYIITTKERFFEKESRKRWTANCGLVFSRHYNYRKGKLVWLDRRS